MNLYAIADLHLSLSGEKPMDIFGDHWKNHPEKIEKAWRSAIHPDDIVLVPGDISWATKPSHALQDLEWIHALPGTKIILKGNHDYWWPKSQRKLTELLPPSMQAIRRNACKVGPYVFFGTRGGDLVPLRQATEEEVRKKTEKELADLAASIEELKPILRDEPELTPVALFHYPPFELGKDESIYTDAIEAVGAKHCVYGHLHTPEEHEQSFQGDGRGTIYHLVSADSLDFCPIKLVG